MGKSYVAFNLYISWSKGTDEHALRLYMYLTLVEKGEL